MATRDLDLTSATTVGTIPLVHSLGTNTSQPRCMLQLKLPYKLNTRRPSTTFLIGGDRGQLLQDKRADEQTSK